MSTNILITLNFVMSVLAFAAVAAGVVLGRSLGPRAGRGEGRAHGCDHRVFAPATARR